MARAKPKRTKSAATPPRAKSSAPRATSSASRGKSSAGRGKPGEPGDAGPTPSAAGDTKEPMSAADAAVAQRGEFYVKRRATALRLLGEMATLTADNPRREDLRSQVIEAHMPYARYLAARYGMPGEEVEDLFQVAYLALVKAVDNFDPERGVAFLTYATPMIIGEIKRYFRDSTWAVHVPRRMQELSAQLRSATEMLGQSLGRSPTVGELAEHLGAEPAEIIDAMDARAAHSTVSLDLPVDAGSARPTPLQDLIGAEDDSFDGVVNRETLKLLLTELAERDKQILLMRFFRGMTQSEIAEQLGVSQMQVSRLLARILSRLRAGMTADLPN